MQSQGGLIGVVGYVGEKWLGVGTKYLFLVIAGCICVCVCGQCLCVLKAGLVFVQPCDLMIKMSLRGRL